MTESRELPQHFGGGCRIVYAVRSADVAIVAVVHGARPPEDLWEPDAEWTANTPRRLCRRNARPMPYEDPIGTLQSLTTRIHAIRDSL